MGVKGFTACSGDHGEAFDAIGPPALWHHRLKYFMMFYCGHYGVVFPSYPRNAGNLRLSTEVNVDHVITRFRGRARGGFAVLKKDGMGFLEEWPRRSRTSLYQ